jgi:hypothetical protein
MSFRAAGEVQQQQVLMIIDVSDSIHIPQIPQTPGVNH